MVFKIFKWGWQFKRTRYVHPEVSHTTRWIVACPYATWTPQREASYEERLNNVSEKSWVWGHRHWGEGLLAWDISDRGGQRWPGVIRLELNLRIRLDTTTFVPLHTDFCVVLAFYYSNCRKLSFAKIPHHQKKWSMIICTPSGTRHVSLCFPWEVKMSDTPLRAHSSALRHQSAHCGNHAIRQQTLMMMMMK